MELAGRISVIDNREPRESRKIGAVEPCRFCDAVIYVDYDAHHKDSATGDRYCSSQHFLLEMAARGMSRIDEDEAKAALKNQNPETWSVR